MSGWDLTCYECGSVLDGDVCVECVIREERRKADEERDAGMMKLAVLAVLIAPLLFALGYCALH